MIYYGGDAKLPGLFYLSFINKYLLILFWNKYIFSMGMQYYGRDAKLFGPFLLIQSV